MSRALSRKSASLVHQGPDSASEFPQYDEVCEVLEAPRRGAQARDRVVRVPPQLFGERLGAGQSERRDVGRLVVRGVLAYGLAERRGRGLLVEDVVDHLKSEAVAIGVVVQTLELSVCAPTHPPP